MPESIGFEVQVPLAFAAAKDATRDALKAEGFGILTEIDLQAAFKEKLGRDFRPYTILGACNPPLAFAAVTADPAIGLLLPCNVTVEEIDAANSMVRLVDPQAMLSSTPGGATTELRKVADDASQRMGRVLNVLSRVIRVMVLLLGTVLSTSGSAQTPGPVQSDDVTTLDGIMKAYYDVVSGPAGSLPDIARDQRLHHPNAQVTLLDRRADGSATVTVTTLEGYYQRGGTGPRKRAFYEREISRATQRIGALVHVWSTYEASEVERGAPFSRGINSIQLYWDGQRWWILGWVFDDERNGGRVPPEYLPAQAAPAVAFGGAQVIIKLPRGYSAGSDPRKDGMAVGY